MTLEQAFQIITQAVAHAHMPLADHQMAQQAIAVVRDACSPKESVLAREETDAG